MPGIRRTCTRAAAAVVLAATVACSPIYRDHGFVPLEEDLASVSPGVDTRETVVEKLGAPSTGSVSDGGDYYYVRSRTKTFGPRRTEVIERNVVAVRFDGRGRVSGVERLGLEDGNDVPLTRRVTSSSTENKGFIRQLLGNLGRFSPADFLGD
ncbi:MAG: outer membrane protein assembly factor BamE [Pseudooceanicola sp.]